MSRLVTLIVLATSLAVGVVACKHSPEQGEAAPAVEPAPQVAEPAQAPADVIDKGEQKRSIEGTAQNAKMGAVLVTEAGNVWVDLKAWPDDLIGKRLRVQGRMISKVDVPVIAGSYGADPAAVAHDAVTAAHARRADFLFVDTAGRLHTKSNLMQELEKLHRIIDRQEKGAPHEVLLVVDATTGMNALNQAREFHKAVPLTGLVITKLDGTSKGGMVVAIHDELNLPIKFIGLGEQADDLQPFDPGQFAEALFAE